MKKRVLWLGVSFLLVAALVLSSCGPAEGQQEEEEEEEEEGEPQYGGELTVYGVDQIEEPRNPDIKGGAWPPCYLRFIEEKLLIGDFEKYGVRGNGEYAFNAIAYIPDKYLKGNLIESWDITPEKTTWHVRPGIHWAADNVDWMENREMTADDIVADLLYFSESPAGSQNFAPKFTDIYATDKYTVVIETPSFSVDLMIMVGYEDRASYTPPEMVTAPGGPSKWENRVGTGPYLFEEYVIGSHMSYVRNPNYWKTTTIDGKEYELPFIDRMIKPIIADESTRTAALRTGKIDINASIPASDWPTLDEKNPEILSKKYDPAAGVRLGLSVKNPPTDSLEVRRALMIGTDMAAFGELEYAGVDVDLPLHWYPMFAGDPTVYTPLEELPAEVRELYDNDPQKAKQMLADAGYPNGFKIEVETNNTAAAGDSASLLKEQWAKFGVEVDIIVNEPSILDKHGYDRTFKDAAYDWCEVASPIMSLKQTGASLYHLNYSTANDTYFDGLIAEAESTIDSVKRNALMKAAGVYVHGQVYSLPLRPSVSAVYWWPWLKNYYGETNTQDIYDNETLLAYSWIDQDLKAEMGF